MKVLPPRWVYRIKAIAHTKNHAYGKSNLLKLPFEELPKSNT